VIHLQAEEEMRHERHTWLLQHILYKEIEEFLLDAELNNQDVALSPDDKQVTSIKLMHVK
jgi:hypothetical protein